MRKTYEKYENEEDLNFGKQKNYPSRRKSTFQAARTAKHTTYVCNVRCVRTCSVRIRTESGRHGFHFQLELFFYALLFFTKHKNVIDRDIDVSLMIFSTYILPNLRCVNNHYSLFLFFL